MLFDFYWASSWDGDDVDAHFQHTSQQIHKHSRTIIERMQKAQTSSMSAATPAAYGHIQIEKTKKE